jgi:hypothetical protein
MDTMRLLTKSLKYNVVNRKDEVDTRR